MAVVQSSNRASATGVGSFAVASIGTFLVSLDVSIANAVLPAIGRSFPGAGRPAISWVISAYAIAFAAALVPAGRFADRAGRRQVFRAGLLVFAAGSLICGVAPNLPVLLAGRVLQAVGAAAAQPASLALLLAGRPAERQAVTTARWFGMGAVGIALGPTVGGLLTAAAGWRWAFLVNLPILIPPLLVAPRVLAETARHPGRRMPDPLGAILFAGAAAALTLALSQLTSWGVGDRRTLGALLAGGGLGWWFIARSARSPDPLLDLRLLVRRHLALTTAVTVLYSASFFALLFSFVLFLTSDWRLPVTLAGVAITPMALVVVALSTSVGGLSRRIGYRAPLAAGTAIIAAGLIGQALVEHGHRFGGQWLPLVALCGVGIGLCYPLLGAAALHGLPTAELAGATAVNQAARQLGAAFGVAVTVAALGTAPVPDASRFHLAWLLAAGLAAAAAVTAAALPRAEAA